MSVKDVLSPLLKWWWLLLAATIVAGVSSYYATQPMPPIYQTTSTVLVGASSTEANPSGTEYSLSIKLAEFYALYAMREPVRDATQKALGLNALPEYIARQIPGNQLIDILVTDTNPERAQAVANELARQLVLQSPTSDERQEQQRRSFLNQQLDELQAEITRTKASIEEKKQELNAVTGAVQLADLQTEIAGLEQKRTLLQTNYASLLSNTDASAVNTMRIIEYAAPPVRPIGPNKPMIIALVSMIGLVLASGAAHLLEFMDKTLKSPDDIKRVLDLPVIGFIGEMDRDKDEWAFVAEYPRSPIAEAFRSLRTNIEFAGVDKRIKTLLLTSADTSDGKTTVATNLATIIAQGEKKVVLLDADLRKPSVHQALGMPIQPGLSEIFRDRITANDAVRSWAEQRVKVITAGTPPPNPAELLGSRKMNQILDDLVDEMDMIVIDGPPILVTDASVLASKVDAVLLVIRPGQTREDVARAMLEQMKRAGANVIGVVLNRIPRRGSEYYGGYHYYSPYYSDGSYYDGKNSGNGPKGGRGRKKEAPPEKQKAAPVISRPVDVDKGR